MCQRAILIKDVRTITDIFTRLMSCLNGVRLLGATATLDDL